MSKEVLTGGARPLGLLEKSHLNTVASAPGTGHKNIKKRLQPLRLQPFCSIIKVPPKMKITRMNYTPIQLKLPVDMERIIEINDSVYTFNEVVSHIDLKKYFVLPRAWNGKIHEVPRVRKGNQGQEIS